MKCGIVGLPNVGKSTLFNALTKAGIEAANYPFCTIEPNVGVVEVPDPRLRRLAEIARPQRIVPAIVQFVDIAGLVKGASHGEGLGNQFLAHIRETDAILHVVRCFDDPDIVHVAGAPDPLRDIEIVDTELALADLATVEKALHRARKPAQAGEKEAKHLVALLEKVHAHLDTAQPVRTLSLQPEEKKLLKPLSLLTAKPLLYVANVAENGLDPARNPHLAVLQKRAHRDHTEVVPISAALEADLVDLDDEEKKLLLSEIGLEEPGLHRLIRAAYHLLGLHTFFTAGPKEVRAWTIPVGATAPQAAGVIHSDFERGFIRAQVIAYDDYLRYRGEAGAREAGKLRSEGKDYIVQDGDIIHFLFNV